MKEADVKKFAEYFKSILKNQCHEAFNEEHLYQGDDVERTSIEGAQALEMKIKGRNALYLRKIEKALERTQDGSFGECEECGAKIGLKRLQARPTATMCINCKEEQESVEGHILYAKKSHTHGKGLETKGFQSLEKVVNPTNQLKQVASL